jgi:hypothetical protein
MRIRQEIAIAKPGLVFGRRLEVPRLMAAAGNRAAPKGFRRMLHQRLSMHRTFPRHLGAS